MKVRDSGMPDEEMWASFFNVEFILSELQINSDVKDLVEIGCGYGTFTLPAARVITGKLYAFDIEKEMIDLVDRKLANNLINNVILNQRDILKQTTGLPDESMGYVMLFNILHHDSPLELLAEANRVLKIGGKVGIIHWRSDIQTPRGPDLSIRPMPEQIKQWISNSNFTLFKDTVILKPFHYGLILNKIDL